MKSSGFFLLGLVAGAAVVLAVDKYRKDHDPEDVDELTRRVAEHLDQLESRLESVIAGKGA